MAAAARRRAPGRKRKKGPAEEAPEESPPERSRTAERLRRAGPAPHADLRAGRLPAPAHRLHAPVLPGAGLRAADRAPTSRGVRPTRCRRFPVPLDCPRPPARRGDLDTGPGQLLVEEHRRRQHALPARADAQRDRPGARARADRRPRQHDHGLDARLARRHRGLQPSRRRRGTPDSTRPATRPTRLPVTNQDPPEVGQNGFVSSIRAKRAWAEVDTEFGSIRFGRMPWHWGRGMFYNQGACADCDVGTTVDRVMGLTTDLRPPDGGGVGPRRAGPDDAAADAGPQRSQRLPVRPVAERRRAAADGRDHARSTTR